jgi:phosphohistidine phosphatase
MKKLYVIRHAKSSWSDTGVKDLDRPLNKRGMRDAPFMAKLLYGKGIETDALVTSPAKRAFDTAQFFLKQWKASSNLLITEPRIYEATPTRLLEIVREFPDDWETVLLFGHNPTLTSFINLFASEYLANLPTCGIAELDSEADKWNIFGSNNTRLIDLYYPRQFFPKKGE